MRQAHVREARPRVGLGAVQPRQLRDRERRDGHRAARRRPTPPDRRAASTSHAASGADSVSFHNFAGRTTAPAVVEHHHPVLLTGDRHRVDVARRRGAARRRCSASHHAVGSCSLRGGVVGGCGARPSPSSAPVSASRTFDLARLRRGVDTEHDGHSLRPYAVRSARVRLRPRRRPDRRYEWPRPVQRRPRRRHLPPRPAARSRPSCPSGGASAASPLHADGGIVVLRARHRARATTAAHRRCSPSRHSRAGTICAPTARPRVRAARCASRCSIAPRTPCPVSCGASTARARRPRLYGDVVHPNGVALSPDEKVIYHSDTRASTRDRAHAARERRRQRPPRHRHECVRPARRPGRRRERGGLGGAARRTVSAASRPTASSTVASRCPRTMATSLCLHGHDLYVTTADHTR